jgi:hypothetical protein
VIFPDGARHTEPVIGWLALIVFTAVPVPPVTLPVILIRLDPTAHLPLVAWVAKWIVPLVVPWWVAQVIVMFRVPALAPFFEVNVPVPLPPVAAVGVQPVTVAWMVVVPVVVNLVHLPGCDTADAGEASGSASMDADAARMANDRARTGNLISLPFVVSGHARVQRHPLDVTLVIA